jgi:hypothetical protein
MLPQQHSVSLGYKNILKQSSQEDLLRSIPCNATGFKLKMQLCLRSLKHPYFLNDEQQTVSNCHLRQHYT